MSVAEELDRLARLHREGMLSAEEFAAAKAKILSARPSIGYAGYAFWSIRRESASRMFGLPLWSIAIGPDPERGEQRGHARGIFAFGDIATGWFAMGGIARGLVAFGGLAVGVIALGGGAVGLLLAVGGGALGGIALGGAAVGVVAVGGAAAGYYALGGAAVGAHAAGGLGRDPEAIEFFRRYAPWLTRSMRF